MKIFVITLLTVLSFDLNASLNIKFRAREHFVDSHQISLNNGTSAKFSGLSNTVNIWHELPLRYSIGLSISPIFSNIKVNKNNSVLLGNKIKLEVYGIEGKYFPIIGENIFFRLGLGQTRISNDSNSNEYTGSSYYFGLGYEIPWKKIFIAPEVALREAKLSGGTKLKSTIFSLGFHFYEFL